MNQHDIETVAEDVPSNSLADTGDTKLNRHRSSGSSKRNYKSGSKRPSLRSSSDRRCSGEGPSARPAQKKSNSERVSSLAKRHRSRSKRSSGRPSRHYSTESTTLSRAREEKWVSSWIANEWSAFSYAHNKTFFSPETWAQLLGTRGKWLKLKYNLSSSPNVVLYVPKKRPCTLFPGSKTVFLAAIPPSRLNFTSLPNFFPGVKVIASKKKTKAKKRPERGQKKALWNYRLSRRPKLDVRKRKGDKNGDWSYQWEVKTH